MGGRGLKDEGPEEDIKEVKAETEEWARHDAGGSGDSVVTLCSRGEAGHAWSLSHAH